MGRSRGGFSTKIHAVVDTHGRPIYVQLTPGQQHEATVAEELLAHARGTALIGDTGYDSDSFIAAIKKRHMRAVICPHPCRKVRRRLDRKLYRLRYLVETFFHDLKNFRAVASRFEKSSRNFLAVIHLACARLWLGQN